MELEVVLVFPFVLRILPILTIRTASIPSSMRSERTHLRITVLFPRKRGWLSNNLRLVNDWLTLASSFPYARHNDCYLQLT